MEQQEEKEGESKPGNSSFNGNRFQRLREDANPFRKEGIERDLSMILLSGAFYFIICLLLGFEELYHHLRYFSFDTEHLLFFIPFILLPPGLYFFRQKKILGWMLLSAWSVYLLVTLIQSAILIFTHKDATLFYQPAGISELLLGAFVFSSMFYALNRKKIVAVLQVHRGVQFISVLIFFILISLLVFRNWLHIGW
jgi:hypothetical protein